MNKWKWWSFMYIDRVLKDRLNMMFLICQDLDSANS